MGAGLAWSSGRSLERHVSGASKVATVTATPAPPGPLFYGGSLPEGLDLSLPQGVDCYTAQFLPDEGPPYEFFFTRAVYSSGGGLRGYGRRGGSWRTDYPKADRQFMVMVNHLIHIDAYDCENPVSFADPAIRRYPWVYALEVGGMYLTPDEIQGMRDYLDAGGFLVIDDFWGSYQWQNFEYNIRQVLPGRDIVELPLDHPIFNAFYSIEEIRQVPNISNARAIAYGYGDRTWEQDGYTPHVLGIFDDDDRLMVVINWNTDLGDAWEWAEDPFYPLDYSRFAAEMGINMIVYGMSH